MLRSLIDWLRGNSPPPADDETFTPEPHEVPILRRGPRYPDGYFSGYPKGYVRDEARDDVFDPALQHYPYGVVKEEPRFADAAEAAEFYEDRSRLLRACVAAIGASEIGPAVVLRGGVTLEIWYGARARRPKDIDLVLRDRSVRPNTHQGERVLFALRALLARTVGESTDADALPIDVIWAYDRAEGRRITCSWTWRGRVKDSIQLDIVFDEPLCAPPVEGEVDGARVWLASREESLAWKILWCTTDRYPQAKDIYDVLLLAEEVRPDAAFIAQVFQAKGEPWRVGYPTSGVIEATQYLEAWPEFIASHPYLSIPPLEVVVERIAAALER